MTFCYDFKQTISKLVWKIITICAILSIWKKQEEVLLDQPAQSCKLEWTDKSYSRGEIFSEYLSFLKHLPKLIMSEKKKYWTLYDLSWEYSKLRKILDTAYGFWLHLSISVWCVEKSLLSITRQLRSLFSLWMVLNCSLSTL